MPGLVLVVLTVYLVPGSNGMTQADIVIVRSSNLSATRQMRH
jgi:hypothetical protein